jgi:hypothetical protein
MPPTPGCQKVAYAGMYIRNLVEFKSKLATFVATQDIKTGEEISMDFVTYMEFSETKKAATLKQD